MRHKRHKYDTFPPRMLFSQFNPFFLWRPPQSPAFFHAFSSFDSLVYIMKCSKSPAQIGTKHLSLNDESGNRAKSNTHPDTHMHTPHTHPYSQTSSCTHTITVKYRNCTCILYTSTCSRTVRMKCKRGFRQTPITRTEHPSFRQVKALPFHSFHLKVKRSSCQVKTP